MKKFIPLEKRSKKEQKAYHDAQRGSWNGVVPVTKVIPNKKAYSRKEKHRRDYPLSGAFFNAQCTVHNAQLAQEKGLSFPVGVWLA